MNSKPPRLDYLFTWSRGSTGAPRGKTLVGTKTGGTENFEAGGRDKVLPAGLIGQFFGGEGVIIRAGKPVRFHVLKGDIWGGKGRATIKKYLLNKRKKDAKPAWLRKGE